jgi:NADH:ubiquinone oxidoreductase subunit 5 (subunit L)/multisubunit Na+/H+ antiporter MnhA subunit
MLAYCTIENIGIIGVGMGLGLIGIGNKQSLLIFLGFGGALLHVLNHALYKSLLFYSAGSVYNQTHTRDMDKLGGLIRKMPQTAILFLTASIAIGGIPPLNGFLSEFLIYSGILTGMNQAGTSQIMLMILTFAGMSFIGGVSVLTFTKTFGTIFLGMPRTELKHEPEEVSLLMLAPQYFILLLMIVISLFPVHIINVAGRIVNISTFSDQNGDISRLTDYLSVMKNISLASVVFIIVSGVIFLLRWIISRGTEKKYSATWGCAYVAPNNKMQYTGKSYSKSLGKLLNFMIIEKKGYNELKEKEIFPAERKYRSFYLDIFESKIIDPLLFYLRRFIDLFQFVQNGRIQAYVIYGIVFILVIFIGTILNFWH